MNLDRNTIRALRERIATALAPIGKEFNMKLTPLSAVFTDNYATMKVEISTISDSGVVHTKEAEEFRRKCSYYGLLPSNLGESITADGTQYTIIGLNPRSKKYPIVVKRIDESWNSIER